MTEKSLLCPVCGRPAFDAPGDHAVCPDCGWKNDDPEGGLNDPRFEAHRKRYLLYIALKPDYSYEQDGFPLITSEDVYRFAHRFSFCNEQLVRESRQCGCFYCLESFAPGEITNWVNDTDGRTALCPHCGIDSVLPDRAVAFDRAFLEGMNRVWF